MNKVKDLTGKQFGNLTVLDYYESKEKCGRKRIYWKCKCDCGKETMVVSDRLCSGKTKSCGCKKYEKMLLSRIKHGQSNSRLYGIYGEMKSRCYNPNRSSYKRYGGRGIKICDEWLGDQGAENFINWATANGYEDSLTIDRINVNGNYEPSNCRWATWQEQSNNKRNNRFITYNGETKTIAEWSRILNIKYGCLFYRINHGWSMERIVNS